MKTRLLSSFAALAALVLLLPLSSNAQTPAGSTVSAATVTTLLSQDFSGSTFPPTGWTANSLYSYGAYSTGWVSSTGGAGASNGSAVAQTYVGYPYTSYPDPPPYPCYAPNPPYIFVGTLPNGTYTSGSYLGPLTLTSPSVNVSGYTAIDTQFVDFDLFLPIGYFEYYGTYYYGLPVGLTITILDGSTTVKTLSTGGCNSSGTFVPGDETYVDNGNTGNPDDPSGFTSSTYWRHYHLPLPHSVTTQSVSFLVDLEYSSTFSCHAWYTLDAAFDNVVITNADYKFLTVNGPTNFNFGSVPVHQSAGPYYSDLTSPLKNGGIINIGNYAISGANAGDFTLTRTPFSIAVPGAKDSVGILYTPQGTGTRSATLTFQLLGGVPGTVTVLLNGSGVAPTVSYNTNALFRQVFTELTDTSAPQYLKVTAVGPIPLTISSVYFYGLNSNSYIVTRLPANPIPGGVTDSIGIRFTPTIEGKPDAIMVINSNASNNPSDTVTMNGIGVLPRLVINNTYIGNTPLNNSNTVNISFGAVNVGGDSCQYITLVNPGSDTLAIEKNFFSSADYDFTITPLTGKADTLLLPGGGSQQIKVCFTPLKQGNRTATIRITTNIPLTMTTLSRDTSAFFVTMTGTGVPFGHLAITGPAKMDTGAVGVQKCWVDTLWNTGQASISVFGAAITGANASEFTTDLKFPINLAPGASDTFSVCATPAAVDTSTALLTASAITSGEIVDTITASLPLNIFGATVCDSLHMVKNFPATTCIGSEDTATISVTNCGNVATPYQASISGANMAQFAVVPPTTSPSESGGGVATFKVTYTPNAANATSTATFNITGGIAHSLTLNAARGTSTIAGSGIAPATLVGAGPMSFTVIIHNTGACEWTPGVPLDTAPFAYVSGANPIPPGGYDTLHYTFDPTAQGTFNQTVGFPNAIGVSNPPANVTISGTTTSASVAMVSAQNGYSIEQNYPNPFGNTSEVEITLPYAGNLHLAILDITGQVVQNVMDREMDAGSFSVTINASELASGTYFYQMTSGGVTLTRQMTIVK